MSKQIITQEQLSIRRTKIIDWAQSLGNRITSRLWYFRQVGRHCQQRILHRQYTQLYCGTKHVSSNPQPVAANESGRVWGDPHFEGGDGGKFDVQGKAGRTYNLLTDTGLKVNGKFAPYKKDKTVVGEMGISLSGPCGNSKIRVRSRPCVRVTHNGQLVRPGQSFKTQDGGRAHLSSCGKKLTIKTREGYRLQTIIKKSGKKGELELKVKTPSWGVARDNRLPGGLLGQTFDADKLARNSKDNQGKGAIKGSYQDYEVPGGVFGNARSKVAPQATNVHGVFNFLRQVGLTPNPNLYFPSQNPLTFEQIDWQREVQQDRLNSYVRESLRYSKKEMHSKNSQINRLGHIMMMALRSGNIAFAMMIFAHIEAKEANHLNKSLVMKMRGLQQKKRQLANQMAHQTTNDANGMKKHQLIKNQVETVNDDISVLQTFIKDVTQNKQQSLELANAFLSQEHQSKMSIVRSMGRA